MAESRRSSTHNLLISACVFAAALVLTGCQANGAEDPETALEVSESASPSRSKSATPLPSPMTPEPTPASSAGPAANVPVPEKPALASKNTNAGLEAFTKWWFELLNYGYVTNNWKPLNAVTDPACRSCQSVKAAVQEVYADGAWIVGAEMQMLEFSTKFELNTAGSIHAFVKKRQEKLTYFNPDGSKAGSDPASEPVTDSMFALYEGGAWLMLDYGKPAGI